MDRLSASLRENEAEIVTAWAQSLDKIPGEPFGGARWADPYKETQTAFRAILDIIERNDRKAAEEQAARLARLPTLRGAGMAATVRGYYALFEALRPVLDHLYPEGQREGLPRDIERLRNAVGAMASILTAAHFKAAVQWQDEWDRMAFHGIRGPVTRMISELQALNAGAADSLAQPFREVLRDATRSSRQLMAIVESIFAMHRLGEGLIDAKPKPLSLAVLLGPVIEDAGRRATADRKTLAGPQSIPAVELAVDREFLAQAIALLVQRALDETEAAGTVRLEIATEPGAVRITIRHQSQEPAPSVDAPEPVEHAFARMALEHVDGRAVATREAGNSVSVSLRIPASAGAAISPRPAPPAEAAPRPAAQAGPSPAPAAPAAPPEIRIMRGSQPVPASGKHPAFARSSAAPPADPSPPAATKEEKELGEAPPEDTARGDFKIIRGLAAGSLPGTDEERKD